MRCLVGNGPCTVAAFQCLVSVHVMHATQLASKTYSWVADCSRRYRLVALNRTEPARYRSFAGGADFLGADGRSACASPGSHSATSQYHDAPSRCVISQGCLAFAACTGRHACLRDAVRTSWHQKICRRGHGGRRRHLVYATTLAYELLKHILHQISVSLELLTHRCVIIECTCLLPRPVASTAHVFLALPSARSNHSVVHRKV